jgi:hypothetical protein
MRATLLLNGPILSDGGLLGPALKCSEVAITSNQNIALAAALEEL